MFHCLEVASEGGENLLVDGFSVAQQFKDKYPEGYAFLSSESFPSEYLEEGQHHSSLDTVFKHNPETGCMSQFRFVLDLSFGSCDILCCSADGEMWAED